jgi:hypothetical protein
MAILSRFLFILMPLRYSIATISRKILAFPLRLRKNPSRLDPACASLWGITESRRGRLVHYMRSNYVVRIWFPICNGVTTRVLI